MHGADDTYVGMLMTVHPVQTWTESQGNNTILAQDVKKYLGLGPSSISSGACCRP